MATMGAALAAFDKMLDDVATWATGSTQAHEQVEQGGRVLRREYDIVAACEALKVARRAIDGDGDEQAAADGLMGVVRAAQWHEIEGGCDNGKKTGTGQMGRAEHGKPEYPCTA